jgi:hypothetical protein
MVPITGANARRVLFGAINLATARLPWRPRNRSLATDAT